MTVPRQATFLARFGLSRPESRAWILYDWANSAMVTVIITAVFPIFWASYASAGLPEGAGTFRYALATTLGLAVIAVLAPFLGAVADAVPWKKRLLGSFMALGVGSVAAMFFIGRGEWMLAITLFTLANIGANGSFVFYDALLPHVARGEEEMNRVSAAGYAIGYLGGGLLLTLNLILIQRPDLFGLPAGEGISPEQTSLPARLAFVSVAVWWLVFAIPLFRRVPEPAIAGPPLPSRIGPAAGAVLRRLGHTLGQLRTFREALLMLVAFLIYNDGIGTIIRMAVVYGEELGFGQNDLILAVLLVQFVGVPFGFLFGALGGRIGAKPAIFLGLLVYAGISVWGFLMTQAWQFYVLAGLVGTVQGGTQALSRSLFASLIPAHQSAEFFGFFAVMEKFAGILGPLFFTVSLAITGSSRNAILSIILFFVVGAALLAKVRVKEGQARARAAEAQVALAHAA